MLFLQKLSGGGHVFNNSFFSGSKLPECLYERYQVCGTYITTLITNKVIKGVFLITFSHESKVSAVFVIMSDAYITILFTHK